MQRVLVAGLVLAVASGAAGCTTESATADAREAKKGAVHPPPPPAAGLITPPSASAAPFDPGAGDGEGPGWLTDPDLWEVVPEVMKGTCQVHQARLPSSKIPRREWVPCGPGCLVAPAVLPGQAGTRAPNLVATERGGEIYYRVTSSVDPATGRPELDEIARLSDDSVVTLLRHQPRCEGVAGQDTPGLFKLLDIDADAILGVGTATFAVGGPVLWAQPGIEIGSGWQAVFTFDGGWGLLRDDAALYVALSPGSSLLTKVFESGAYQVHPVGRGSLVAWTDWSDWSPQTRAKLRGWTQAQGTSVFVQGPWDVVHVALSDVKIVWTGAEGLAAIEGNFGKRHFYWSPIATTPAGIDVHQGPEVPLHGGGSRPTTTWGDWVATTVADDEANAFLFVANFATGKTWLVPSRPGHRFLRVMAMNAATLLVQEFIENGPEIDPDNIVRVALAQLDALAEGG